MLTIMGLDPGFGRTGYGVIHVDGPELHHVAHGCVKTSSALAFDQRLAELHKRISALLRQYNPDRIGIEQLYFAKNVTTAIDVAQARGVILLACSQAAIPTHAITPPEVKLAVAGFGNAKKPQVQMMIKTLLRLNVIPTPDDAADALAIAIAVSARAAK